MSEGTHAVPGATPVFVDTSAWYAIFDEDDGEHARATSVLNAIHAGDLPYRPIYTAGHVLAELATLLLRHGHDVTSRALGQIRDSPNVTVSVKSGSSGSNSSGSSSDSVSHHTTARPPTFRRSTRPCSVS